MAGVIAQLTANARKRHKESVIDSGKSVYILPHFHQYGFRPSFDNLFIIRRSRQNQIEFYETKLLEDFHLENQVCIFLNSKLNSTLCFRKRRGQRTVSH